MYLEQQALDRFQPLFQSQTLRRQAELKKSEKKKSLVLSISVVIFTY
jgi:hypothetical protein